MVLTNGFAPDPRVYKEAQFLIQKGYQVTILCWDRESQFKKSEIMDGIKIERLHYNSTYGSGFFKQSLSFMKFLFYVKKYIKKHPFNFIHLHDLDSGILTLLVKKNNKKWILDLHEQYDRIYKGFKRKIVRILLTKISQKMDSFVLVNELQFNDYKEIYQDKKVIILPNYPEKKIFNKLNKVKSKKIRISFIGSVRDYKSLSTLIETFGGDLRFQINIIGKGVAQKQLQEKYSNIENVKFVDSFTYNEIIKYYNETDLTYAAYDIINDNYNLAIPVKVYESIMCEIPVIVSKGTEVDKFITSQNLGIAVPFGDGDLLRKCVENLIFTEKYQEIKKALAKVSNKYVWEEAVNKLGEIYEEK